VIILCSSDPVFGRSLNGMLPLLMSEADSVTKLLKSSVLPSRFHFLNHISGQL
jgi:hypothetical protein